MLRPLQRELHVSASCQAQSLRCATAFDHCLLHRFGQPVKSLRGYGRQQIVLVAKMAIRRIVRHASPPRNFPQGERLRPNLADQPYRRVQEALLQIQAMIRAFRCHAFFVTEDVDKRNIWS